MFRTGFNRFKIGLRVELFDNVSKPSGFKQHEICLYQLNSYQLNVNIKGHSMDRYDASFTVYQLLYTH
jgi:hypothetical protein